MDTVHSLAGTSTKGPPMPVYPDLTGDSATPWFLSPIKTAEDGAVSGTDIRLATAVSWPAALGPGWTPDRKRPAGTTAATTRGMGAHS